jgi:hypothetical protein
VGEGVELTFQAIVVPGALYSLTNLLQPGTSKLNVPLIDKFVTDTDLVKANIDLGRSDGWKGIGRGEGRELSVYSATLRGTLRHRGVRYVLILPQSRACILTMKRAQRTSNPIPGVFWSRCRNHILLHHFHMPRCPTSAHGLLDRAGGTRGSFTGPIGFLTKA